MKPLSPADGTLFPSPGLGSSSIRQICSFAVPTPARCGRSLPKGLGYISANVLIAVVLYANAAIILDMPLSRVAPGWRLPLPQELLSAFHLFGVFSHFETFNREIELYGERSPSESNPTGELVRLSNRDFFAFQRGEILSRILVGDTDLYTREQRHAAIRDFAARIRRRYNRLHPEQPIQKVVIAEATWPRSLVSYDFLKANATVDIIFAE